jgi:hypothetical protein
MVDSSSDKYAEEILFYNLHNDFVMHACWSIELSEVEEYYTPIHEGGKIIVAWIVVYDCEVDKG